MDCAGARAHTCAGVYREMNNTRPTLLCKVILGKQREDLLLLGLDILSSQHAQSLASYIFFRRIFQILICIGTI